MCTFFRVNIVEIDSEEAAMSTQNMMRVDGIIGNENENKDYGNTIDIVHTGKYANFLKVIGAEFACYLKIELFLKKFVSFFDTRNSFVGLQLFSISVSILTICFHPSCDSIFIDVIIVISCWLFMNCPKQILIIFDQIVVATTNV
jgi:hypothetical protein